MRLRQKQTCVAHWRTFFHDTAVYVSLKTVKLTRNLCHSLLSRTRIRLKVSNETSFFPLFRFPLSLSALHLP